MKRRIRGIFERPRRDMCYLIGRRAARLDKRQSAKAWQFLARKLEEMGDLDIPKFGDLITTIRAATLIGKSKRKDKL